MSPRRSGTRTILPGILCALALVAASVLLTGCPNGCDWPDDECARAADCAAGEVCAWTGNDGVGGHDACFPACAESPVDDPCGRVACETGRRFAPTGVFCLGSDAADDPTWETTWPDEGLRAIGEWSEAPMGLRINGCACPAARQEGRWAEWAEDGRPLWEKHYAAGALDGDERQWYDNGVLRLQQRHRAGRLDGDYEGWYRNAQAEYLGRYRNGLGQGLWTYWHLNGGKRGEGTYVDGNRGDDWQYWDEDGNPVDTMPPRSDDSAF